MSVLSPSFGVAAALRADIITVLKSGGTPEELANSISPSLSIVNQWSTQIPTLLSVDNSGSCIDLVFAMRKDLFHGPFFCQASFGPLVADLPEPFESFLVFTRNIISAQKAEKASQKVRFSIFYICSSNDIPSQPAKRTREIKSKPFIDEEEPESATVSPDSVVAPGETANDPVCLV